MRFDSDLNVTFFINLLRKSARFVSLGAPTRVGSYRIK